ncbi:MAG: hypothetical protein P1U65_06145 [Minwuia sp.]|nr:hypothetical protein [Minwuia sp.]
MTAPIDDLLDNPPDRDTAATEAEWRQIWMQHDLGQHAPVAMAIMGGLHADRLAWVFVSGYQAAMAHCFPELPVAGWSALAGSEDRHDPVRHPGVRMTQEGDGWRVNGFKSWVAQSAHLDHLIITARKPGEEDKARHAVLLDAHAPGITLSHRDDPGYIVEMSQGFAQLDNVDVPEGGQLGDDRLRPFTRAEPAFILLAGAALLWTHVKAERNDLREELRGLIRGLAQVAEDALKHPKDMARLDTMLQHILKNEPENTESMSIPGWKTDKQLLSIYSPVLQRRAARA